jgi:hypothetical protein
LDEVNVCEDEAPHIEFQIGIWNSLPLAHFEEAVEDEEEFLEIGRSNSVTLHTLATDFITE